MLKKRGWTCWARWFRTCLRIWIIVVRIKAPRVPRAKLAEWVDNPGKKKSLVNPMQRKFGLSRFKQIVMMPEEMTYYLSQAAHGAAHAPEPGLWKRKSSQGPAAVFSFRNSKTPTVALATVLASHKLRFHLLSFMRWTIRILLVWAGDRLRRSNSNNLRRIVNKTWTP